MKEKLLGANKSYLSELKQCVSRKAILKEEDVKDIKVEHPGVLEVPEGKDVKDLGEGHFKSLIKKKGWNEISKALMNLVRWNKSKEPSLSSWAHGMQKKLSDWVDKERENDPNFGE